MAAAKAEREEAEHAEQADFAAQLAALGLGPVEKAPSVIGEEP
ncbi:hypothetical protein [Cystobacter fuscus]